MWYAQTGEDQKLASLLVDKVDGFYIDLGAWEPTVDSVTKWFYERGWHGINVEPVPAYHAMLERERSRDINLCTAVGDHVGEAQMVVMPGTGLSTFVPENAARQEHEKFFLMVPVTTLAEICERYIPHGSPIDFLKIDVEGWEREAIAGGNWEIYRPTIIVVEATVPGTGAEAWHSWEPLLEAADYQFIEFDGLNRWYRDQRSRLRYWWSCQPAMVAANRGTVNALLHSSAETLFAESSRMNVIMR